jgi:hypothetical protein
LKIKHESLSPTDSYPMDKLYAQLSEQHSIMQQQTEASKAADDETAYTRGFDHQSSCSSMPLTPAIEVFSAPTALGGRSASATPIEGQETAEELLRLKLELAQAQSKISRLDQELAHNRVKPESGCATPALVPEHDYASAMVPSSSPPASRIGAGALALNAPGKMPPFSRENSWITQDDTPSEMGDPLPATGLNRPRGIWNNNTKPAFGGSYPQGQMVIDGPQQQMPWPNNRAPSYEPTFPPPGLDIYRPDRMAPEQDAMRPVGRRSSRYENRFGSSNNFSGGFNNYNMGPAPYEMPQGYPAGPQAMVSGGMGMSPYSPYQQQPVGTALSPHATEFTSINSSWKGEVSGMIE